MAIYDDDLFLVNRNGYPYKMASVAVNTNLDDNDLLWVQRNGINYSVTGKDIKELAPGLVDVVVENVTISENDDGDNSPRFTDQSFTTNVNCNIKANEPIVFELKAKAEGSLVVQAKTSVITGVTEGTDVVLELTDNTELTFFNPGDEVVQNGGGTPKTSAITNVAGNVLTLTDDTNLANFSVGDVVQTKGTGNTAWNETQVWSASLANVLGASSATYAFDGSFDTNSEASSTSANLEWNGTLENVNTLRIRLRKTSTSQVWTADTTITGTGLTTTQIPTSDVKSLVSIPVTSTTVSNIVIDNNDSSNTVSLCAIEVNGKILVDGSAVKVTAIDEATPSITTDRGSWSGTDGSGDPDGETFITGPTLPAATGTVSSIDAVANTMTVSASTGRWLVTKAGYQQDLKLNKVAQSKDFIEVDNTSLFAIFDDSGAITDFTLTDPGYRQMTSGGTTSESFNLQFPSILPNGRTPDVTLPDGATFCVDVKARNSVDPNKFSELTDTCITPIGVAPPKSTMHGLRFDAAREANLIRPSSAVSSWTASFWVKPTAGGNKCVLSAAIGNDDRTNIRLDGTKLHLHNRIGTTTNYDSNINTNDVALNQWTHCVVSHDGTTVKNWVNGNPGSDTALPSTMFGQTSYSTFLGKSAPAASNEMLNGYLSDVYFVDGQALPPTAFGYDFENQGKWAALDKTVIKQNITTAGGFGANGFYLPFDPAATGANYGSNYPKLFNGTALTDSAIASDGYFGGVGATQTFDNLTNITPATSIQIQGYATQGGTISINDESPISLNMVVSPGQTATGYTQVIPYSGAITKLVFVSFSTSNLGVGQIVIDGKILVDYNSIGVDDSGNENHFHDQNFAVGNTSQIWSNYWSGGLAASSAKQNSFDGDLDTHTQALTGSSMTWTPPTPIAFSTFRLYIGSTNNDPTKSNLKINGNPYTTNVSTNWQEITGYSSIESVTIGHIIGQETIVKAMELDGVLLVNPNAVDTVTDTPLKNYATLLTGTNGNLVATGDSSTSYLGEVGTNYYYEEDGVSKVHTGGATFSSVSGKTYNFGQQPFATQYDDSQIWSNYASANVPFFGSSSYVNGFDGDLSTKASFQNTQNPGIVTLDFTGLGLSGDVEVYCTDTSVSVDVNSSGSPVNLAVGTWTTFPNSGVVNTIEIICTRGSSGTEYFGAIKVGGKLLIDTGHPLTLFQTWEQWNNVATLRADNPLHVAKFEAIKKAEEAYPGDKVQFRQQLAAKIAPDLTTDELNTVIKLIK